MSNRSLTTALKNAVQADVVYPVLFAEIQTASGYERAWSGYGTLTWDGKTWDGTGLLGQVSAVQETCEVYAAGVTFSLSGVPEAQISLALADMRQGRTAKLWLGAFDGAGVLLADPYLLFAGLTDIPTIDDDPEGATLNITAENRLIRLKKANVRRWTPEDQKIDHPADRGFDFVAGLVEAEIVWR